MAKKQSKGDIYKQQTACAALSYWVVGLIWYYLDKNMQSTYVKFHVKQGIIILIMWVIVQLVTPIIVLMSLGLMSPVAIILEVAVFILAIIGTVQAINRSTTGLPIVKEFTDKLKF